MILFDKITVIITFCNEYLINLTRLLEKLGDIFYSILCRHDCHVHNESQFSLMRNDDGVKNLMTSCRTIFNICLMSKISNLDVWWVSCSCWSKPNLQTDRDPKQPAETNHYRDWLDWLGVSWIFLHCYDGFCHSLWCLLTTLQS